MVRPLRARSLALYTVVGSVGLACIPLVRRTMGRWGATSKEATRVLPGDDGVPRPQIASTRAIAIHAPAATVWPWLVQMGWKKAGWYSYDRIDNEGIPSAERIVPELQDLQIGDVVPEGADVGWTVEELEPNRLLLLTAHAPMAGVDWVQRRDSSWLFFLDEIGPDDTRLIERSRTSLTMNDDTLLGRFLAGRFGTLPLISGDFVMAHRQMQGIKRRAERDWRERTEQAAQFDRVGPASQSELVRRR
jgi:hypothetical protein